MAPRHSPRYPELKGEIVKRSILKTGIFLAAALAAFAQTPAAPPAFEVASIKPAEQITPAMVQAGKMHVGMSVDGARVDIGFFSLYDLIYTAYKLKPYQVEGPDWIHAERFDVVAKMPAGATKDDAPLMLQALLKDRFHLEFHRDHKEHPVYALIVAPGGPKMKDAEPDPAPEAEPKPLAKGEVVMGQGENAARVKMSSDGTSGTAQTAKGNVKFTMSPDGMMHYEYSKLDMSTLADALSQMLDKPAVDMTGLTGKYQIALDFSRDDLMNVARKNGFAIPQGGRGDGGAPAEAASDPGSNSIFNAIKQLGLKLDSRKAPLEVIVVDHAEKMPTEN
jgi:uncharacterized protein (TIGR03435 family)